jgi:hypothetical protein
VSRSQTEAGSVLERFKRFVGREPSDAEIQRIGRLQEMFDLRGSDSIWLLWWAFEYYLRLYEAVPRQIGTAAKESAGSISRLASEHMSQFERTVVDALQQFRAVSDSAKSEFKAMVEAEHAKMAAQIAASLHEEVPTALKRAARAFEWRNVGITVAISAMMLLGAWAVGHYTRDTVLYHTTSAAPVSAADMPTKDVCVIARRKHKKQAAAETRGKATVEGATHTGSSEAGSTFLQ